ncbi:phosphatase [Jiella sp. M17.18]|uniref:phosphatase n=1 Tax=Jiella sp. M17.18 TaxID=3234247 RepID=UPI0034DED8AA
MFSELSPSDVISIKSPDKSYLGPKDLPEGRHLIVEFEDVEAEDAAGAPTAEQVSAILGFVAKLPEDARLLIHGLQGVRRAPAVAIGILATLLSPVEAAGAAVPCCRHPADPNRLVLQRFDAALSLRGELVAACAARFVPGRATLRRREEGDGVPFAFDMLAGSSNGKSAG